MKRLPSTIGACLILLATMLLASSPASADTDPSCTTACSGSVTFQLVSDACAQLQALHDQYGTDIPAGMCDGNLETITETYSVSAPFTPTATAAVANPTACGSGCENPVQCKSWKETLQSVLNGAFWNETHKGVYCFNTTTTWAPPASKYSQTTYHKCNINSGNGFTIDNQGCWGNLVQPTNGLDYRQQWDDFKVQFVYKGSPISAHHEMHVGLRPNGNINFVKDS